MIKQVVQRQFCNIEFYNCYLIVQIEFSALIYRRFYMQKNSNSKTSNYKFSEIFGYKGPNQPVQEEDIITSLKFDAQGKFIALGDKAGRIIIFQNSKPKDKNTYQLNYLTQFQSHCREFDPLKSEDIDEEIVDMSWLKPQGKYLKMATTNCRSIKLWKIFQKTQKKIVKSAGKELSAPKLQKCEVNYTAEPQKVFKNKHIHPIKQLSPSCNEQFLLSTDKSQAFLWDLQRPQKPYIVCDLGMLPSSNKVQEQQTISCCQMHPKNDSIFLYGMSKGSLKLGDLRISSDSQSNSTCFKIASTSSSPKNYLLNIISNISSATFADSRYIISRDYLTVKIWDICNTKKPVNAIILNEGLKSKLCDLVQNQCIFDQFKLSVSSDCKTIVSGSYNNSFHMMDLDGNNSQYELNYKKQTICKNMAKSSMPSKMDYTRKVLVNDYNSMKNMAAVASLNCFYTYTL